MMRVHRLRVSLLIVAVVLTFRAVAATADATAELTPVALVARAREHAAAERHAAAVRDFRAAVALDAELLPSLARELGFASLWADDATAAVGYLRRHLALHSNQDDREARQALALALSWSGHQDEAIAAYRQLLGENSADGEVRLGLGRSLVWNNQLREGHREIRAVEKRAGDRSPVGKDGARFLLDVLDGYETPWEARFDLSHDSDRLQIVRLGAKATVEVPPSLLVQAMPSRAWYDQDSAAGITAWRAGVGLIAPLAPNWNLHAYGWIDRFRGDGPPPGAAEQAPLRWTQPGGDFWLTWHAAPKMRWDFGGSVLPVETLLALHGKTHSTQGSVSLDWRLTPVWALSAATARGVYSDDNRRWLSSARLAWHREGRFDLSLGPVLTYLDFSQPGIGYWSPPWMRNASLDASITRRGALWLARVNGRYGLEKELQSAAIGVGGVSGHMARRVGAGVLVALDVGHSRSRLTSSSGYNRTFVGLSVRGFF